MTKRLWLVLCLFLLTACDIDLSGKPPFDELVFSSDYSQITMPDGRTWNVTYEYSTDTTFTGIVRHTSLWYDSSAPFMSHDILVTTGDFALPELVDVSVLAHKFFYHWSDARPVGTINLLHILPLNSEIFDQLKQIDKWDNVTISGREILRINVYDETGRYAGFMMDTGCNTILVKSVSTPSP